MEFSVVAVDKERDETGLGLASSREMLQPSALP